MPDGWVETPEIDPDADTKLGNQSVYAIFARWRVLQVAYSVSYTDKRQNVVYDQLVKPPTLVTDYLTRCVHNLPLCASSFLSRLNPRFQLLRHKRSSRRTYHDDADRHTSTSPNADNAIDDSARSLVGVRLACLATLAPTVHRYGLGLPSPPRPTAEAGSSLACAQVARSHDT